MNRLLPLSMILALLLASIAPTWAQEPVWRCGATITNRLPEDLQERQACVGVSLPLATTVHVSPVEAVAPLKGTVQSVSAPERTEQKQRDAQARQLLLGEVERVQARWRNEIGRAHV